MIHDFFYQAFKHVFTSPSSVDDDEPKATRSGNARIHNMTSVTTASLAYIATQVGIAQFLTWQSVYSLLSIRSDSLSHRLAPFPEPIP
jgi:hypothetical protein